MRAMVDQEKIEKAKQLRSDGLGWLRIMQETGISVFSLKCELIQGYREKHVARKKQKRLFNRENFVNVPRDHSPKKYSLTTMEDGSKIGHAVIGDYVSSVSVPRIVQERQIKNLAFQHQDLTAALCGDPPPWRSALAKKQGVS